MLEGLVADRFQVLGPLGEGGSGTVVRARDAATGRTVALKVLAPLHDDAARLQFKQAFSQLARLRHPHLASVDDFGFLPDGRPFLCLECVEGQDLAALMPMPVARLLALLPQLATALAYLHRHGLVHGDVKPANVRVTPEGTLKLLDLGFAIASGQAARRPRGSSATMAPELVRGDPVDARTDLYALGATCFQLLAGEPPYPDGGRLEDLRQHLIRPPRSVRERVPEAPLAVDAAIQRLLAREAVARPRSALEALALFGLEAPPEADAQPLVAAFAGRADELALLGAELAALAPGRGVRPVFLVGAAGAGKTRLLEELRALARLAGRPYLGAVCGLGRGRPFGPFLQVVEAAGPAAAAALASAPPDQRAALARLLPAWRLPEEQPPLEPREERVVAQAALCHVLKAIATPTGAVLAIDDWDRADAASVETLAYMRRNAGGAALLVVATGREQGYMGASARVLPPLTPAEVGTLAGSMLGEGAPPAGFVAALTRWTGGHAGQVQRITAHLLASGALVREGGRWTAPRGLAAGDLAPDILEAALAPLAALTGPATAVAEAVAVLDADADLATLAGVADLPEDVFFAALAELQARRILALADGRAGFTSGGLQQAAYERASVGRRLWLHALAARQLERQAGADPVALAGHLIASHQTPRAMAAVLAAAEVAMARFEVDRARGLLADALALAREWPGDHARWRRDALAQLAANERWRGDFDAMAACLDEAEPLAEALGEPGPLLRLWVLRAAHHNQRMTPVALERAAALLERALALPVEDPPWQARGRFYLAQAHFYLGRAAQAAAGFEAAAAGAAAAGLQFWRGRSLAFLGYLETSRGEEAGYGRLAEAAALQEALGDRYGRCFTFALSGEACLAALRLPEAEAAFAAQLALARELGVAEDHVTSLVNLGLARWLAGRPGPARLACEEAGPLAATQGLPVGVVARAIEGLSLACAGDLARATAVLAEAGDEREEGGYMFASAVPYMLEGWRWLGRPDEVLRLAERVAGRSGVDAALCAALVGEARLALAGPAAARGPAAEARAAAAGAPLARLWAGRLAARLALAEGRAAEALEAGTQALALAERVGAAGLAAELSGLVGAAAVALDHPGAGARYRATRLWADREGVPFLRAVALAGEAAAEPHRVGAEALRLEAIQVVQALAGGLEPLARKAFLTTPACAAVLGDAPPEAARTAAGARDELGQVAAAALRRQAAVDGWLQALAPGLGAEALLARVLAVALEHTRADRALVLAPGPAGWETAARLHRRAADGHEGAFSRAACDRVRAEGAGVSLLDAPDAEADDPSLRSLVAVPLGCGGELAGVLYLDARAVLAAFTQEDLALATTLGRLAGAAVVAARRYEALAGRGSVS